MTVPLGTASRPTQFALLLTAFAAGTAALLLYHWPPAGLLQGGPWPRESLYRLVYGATAGIAVVAAIVRGAGAARGGWLAVAAAAGIFVFGGLVRVLTGWTGGPLSPGASLTVDVAILAWYPLMIAGLVRLLPRPRRRSRATLDFAIFALSLVVILVFLWLRQMEKAALPQTMGHPFFEDILVPLGDTAVLFTLAGLLVSRAGRGLLAWQWLVVLGTVTCVLGDIIYLFDVPFTVQVVRGCWTGGTWLLGLAALLAARAPGEDQAVETAATAVPRYSFFPYAALATLLLLLFFDRPDASAASSLALVTGVVLVTGLLVARQVAALEENRRLATTRIAQEARFRALVQWSSDAFLLTDTDGTLRFHSPSFPGLFGLADGDYAGRPLADLVAPGVREPLLTFLRRLASAQTLQPQLLTIEVDLGGGLRRELEIVGGNQAAVPEVGGLVLNARDVTERRQLEGQLRQAVKMEGIGRLAGGVAHDFNNLLTAILGYADLLAPSLEDRPEALGDLREIRRAGERASELTRQLLAFARRQVVDPRVVDLRTLLPGMERMLQRVLGEDVRLETAVAEDLWPILADPGQVEQVVVNLAVNARDAMPAGGRLVLRAVNVPGGMTVPGSRERAEGDQVALTVTDTGVGMGPETVHRIFDPFFTTKPAGQGTGLGLSTVYGIVRQADGHVGVTSAPGEGTTFTLLFPRTESAAEEEQVEVLPVVVRGSGTLLVVEDDEAVRQLMLTSLGEQGYRTIAASHGGEALVRFAEAGGAVDLVVTDVVMPEMGGPELVSRLHETHPGLKVLFISGYAEDRIVHHGVVEPGHELLPKPFLPGQLLARVQALLAQN